MKHRLIRWMQKRTFPASNSFAPSRASQRTLQADGFVYINDLAYGTQFPNSFLDLYLQPNSLAVPAPTVFFVHGGGYVWGHKTDGDPRKNATDRNWFLNSYLKAGYNVASIEYAYAPDYGYPTPVLQLGEAMRFLVAGADTFGLDMERIVLNGGSAGGQLIGQFANIQTNPAYAEEMKIEPVIDRSKIKAMVFNSALLDNERFGKTDNAAMNFLFNKCGCAFFNTRKLAGNQRVMQSDVIRHVTAAFPPSFISDANASSFADQARDFAEKLEALGVKHVLNIYPKTEVKQFHGFESIGDMYGTDNMKKTLAFLENCI